MFLAPVIGVDTIRFITTLTRLNKELKILGLVYQEASESLLKIFNREVERSKDKIKLKDCDLKVVSISKSRTLLGYMLIKKNYKSITKSKQQKRAKGHHVEVVFAGLFQPSKKHKLEHVNTSYAVIQHFVKKFKIHSIDFSIDVISKLEISYRTQYKLDEIFSDCINKKSDTDTYFTSYYNNNPVNFESDRFIFERLLVYDKYEKETGVDGKIVKWTKFRNIPEDWRRIELTLQVNNEKLNSSLLDDMVDIIESLEFNKQVDRDYDETFLEKQKELLGVDGL